MLAGVPVAAEELNSGDVFYCESNVFAVSGSETDWKLKQYRDQKFKIKVTDEVVSFTSDGWFDGLRIGVAFFVGTRLEAKSMGESLAFTLTGGNKATFVYSHVGFHGFVSITADCDRF